MLPPWSSPVVAPSQQLGRTWTLELPGRPVSLNSERREHWSLRAAATKVWRDAGWVEARILQIPPLDVIGLAIHVDQSGRLQDTVNCYPSVKAVVDGLVDAKVIADDTPEHVRFMVFEAPVRCKPGRDKLTITVMELTTS